MGVPKFSIIVPVYNIESYIERNICSLLQQDNIDYEIIYINDGSTDNTSKIIESYMKKYNNISLVNIRNSGAGIARNIGLDYAKGEYIFFADGDDYIDKNILSLLYETARTRDLDILLFDYNKVTEENNVITKVCSSRLNTDEIINGEEYYLGNYEIGIIACQIIRRQLFSKHKLRFISDQKRIYIGEDIELLFRAFFYAERISKIDICGYNYLQRENSIVSFKNIDKSYNFFEVVKYQKLFFSKVAASERTKKIITNRIKANTLWSINIAIYQGFRLKQLFENIKFREEILQELKTYNDFKYKLVYYLIRSKAYLIYEVIYNIKCVIRKS